MSKYINMKPLTKRFCKKQTTKGTWQFNLNKADSDLSLESTESSCDISKNGEFSEVENLSVQREILPVSASKSKIKSSQQQSSPLLKLRTATGTKSRSPITAGLPDHHHETAGICNLSMSESNVLSTEDVSNNLNRTTPNCTGRTAQTSGHGLADSQTGDELVEINLKDTYSEELSSVGGSPFHGTEQTGPEIQSKQLVPSISELELSPTIEINNKQDKETSNSSKKKQLRSPYMRTSTPTRGYYQLGSQDIQNGPLNKRVLRSSGIGISTPKINSKFTNKGEEENSENKICEKNYHSSDGGMLKTNNSRNKQSNSGGADHSNRMALMSSDIGEVMSMHKQVNGLRSKRNLFSKTNNNSENENITSSRNEASTSKTDAAMFSDKSSNSNSSAKHKRKRLLKEVAKTWSSKPTKRTVQTKDSRDQDLTVQQYVSQKRKFQAVTDLDVILDTFATDLDRTRDRSTSVPKRLACSSLLGHLQEELSKTIITTDKAKRLGQDIKKMRCESDEMTQQILSMQNGEKRVLKEKEDLNSLLKSESLSSVYEWIRGMQSLTTEYRKLKPHFDKNMKYVTVGNFPVSMSV